MSAGGTISYGANYSPLLCVVYEDRCANSVTYLCGLMLCTTSVVCILGIRNEIQLMAYAHMVSLKPTKSTVSLCIPRGIKEHVLTILEIFHNAHWS